MSVKVTWRKLMNRPYIKISGNGDEYLWLDPSEAAQLICDLQASLMEPHGHRPDNGTDGNRL
jgi:hypothetical protein